MTQSTRKAVHSNAISPEIQAYIDQRIEAERQHIVAALLGPAKPAFYFDRKGQGIPGTSDRRSKELIRACPHSVKRGRWWLVSVEAFEGWERSQLPPAAPASEARVAETWSPGAAFAIAQLRGTR